MEFRCFGEFGLAEYVRLAEFVMGKSMIASIERLSAFLLVALTLTACAINPTAATQNMKGETDDLADVAAWSLQLANAHGPDRILVVFDIDNTLLAMEQGLGSDQWYYWQKDLEQTDPCSPMRVANRFAVQGALFHASAMRATQPDAAEQVRRIQQAGIPVIALTSRGADYRLQTFRELRRQDISFWGSALPPQHGWAEDFVPASGSRPARYEDGVFLTAGQHKGDMLADLLDRTGVERPAVIMIIDDKAANLDAVLERFVETETRVHAWRYTREDKAVAAFDAETAARQWDVLRPALNTVEMVLGPDNYSLPERVECTP